MKGDAGDEQQAKAAQILKERFFDQNKLGVATGAGFYTYPNPNYQQPDFLKA